MTQAKIDALRAKANKLQEEIDELAREINDDQPVPWYEEEWREGNNPGGRCIVKADGISVIAGIMSDRELTFFMGSQNLVKVCMEWKGYHPDIKDALEVMGVETE